MSVLEELRALDTAITGLVDDFRAATEAAGRDGSDRALDTLRDVRGRLNLKYWSFVFARLDAVLADSSPDALAFTAEDLFRINYGWVSDLLTPRDRLPPPAAFTDGEFQVLLLGEWLTLVDRRYMEVDLRLGLEAERLGLAQSLVAQAERLEMLRRQRRELLAAQSGGKANALADLFEEFEMAEVTVQTVDRVKKSRSIGKRHVEQYDSGMRTVERTQASITAALSSLSPGDQAILREISQSSLAARLAVLDLQSAQRRLEARVLDSNPRLQELQEKRSEHLKDALRQIKEDIAFCARWGRSEASAVLLALRPIHTKADVVEAIRQVEDYDPELFKNRVVEKRGRPLILLTPGSGNGSFDFRTNTLVIPITSPKGLLESVAYALSLYRRDVDHEVNEEKDWKSFFDDDLWRKIEDRSRPQTLRDRLNEWASAYLKWVTKETRGLAVLESELRRWFEERVAPSRRGVIVPRALRHVRASDRQAILERLGEGRDARDCYQIGVLHFTFESFAEALRQFDRAIELDPSVSEAHWARGVMYLFDEERLKVSDCADLREMRLRDRLAGARDSFQQYTRHAGQSWWLLKAQDYLRELNYKISALEGRAP
ncbi:MAG: hypothetical protein HYY93_17090 [Planctomycetes bacterium]|nr:hypothetical protein [Planctomycetota bacterium]